MSDKPEIDDPSDQLGGRADEVLLLTGFLDWYRAVVAHKVETLSMADASHVMTSTGLSPLGIVAHLAAVEVAWFAETFAGETVDPEWDDHGSFRLGTGDSVDSILVQYQAACERSQAIASDRGARTIARRAKHPTPRTLRARVAPLDTRPHA
jgi:hypothetical protein